MSTLAIPTKLQTLHIPAGRRILVTGDIHGHRELLAGLLREASFSSDDVLIIVGDMIQKGPDSLGTLRFVMELAQKGNVYPLMGNVDAFVLGLLHNLSPENCGDFYGYAQRNRRWYGSSFYLEMARGCGHEITCPEDILRCKDEILTRYAGELAFLRNLPTVLETQNYVFVHGGLRRKDPADNLHEEMYALTKYDRFLLETPHVFDKYVVVGHYPVSLYRDVPCYDPLIDREKHIISIDGGCGVKQQGQLNLFMIPDIHSGVEETSFLRRDELPAVTALEDQEGAAGTAFINWDNRWVDLLEEGDEFSLVRHRHSGKELWVPADYVRNQSECSDYSDNALSVRKGDRLGLIRKTSRGIIAKRDGTVGWYFGAYRE